MRTTILRRLSDALLPHPSEAMASALVREHFDAIRVAHRAALARGLRDPLLLVTDPRCDFARAVCASNGVATPTDVCLFTTTADAMLASFGTSTPEKVAAMRRALDGLPAASAESVRLVVFTGGDMTFLPYLLTATPKAA